MGEEDEEISLVEIAEKFYECLDVICKDYSEGFQVDNDYGDNIPGYYEIKDCLTEALDQNFFWDVVEAWNDIATCMNTSEEEKDQSPYIAKMLRVVLLMDDQIYALYRADRSYNSQRNDEDKEEEEEDDEDKVENDVDNDRGQTHLSTACRHRLLSSPSSTRAAHSTKASSPSLDPPIPSLTKVMAHAAAKATTTTFPS